METKPLKTTDKLVVESCEITNHGPRITLKGCEYAKELRLKHFGIDPDLFTFSSVFELDYFFYYELCHYKGAETVMREVGVGELAKDEEFYYVDRRYCMYHQTGENNYTPSPSFYVDALKDSQTADEYLIISYSPIANAMQLFLNPHSIPFTDVYGPSSVTISENSVLGRLDGSVQSININDLLKKPIVLNSKKLPPKATKGTIIMDSADGMIKIYNGEVWKTLKYEDT